MAAGVQLLERKVKTIERHQRRFGERHALLWVASPQGKAYLYFDSLANGKTAPPSPTYSNRASSISAETFSHQKPLSVVWNNSFTDARWFAPTGLRAFQSVSMRAWHLGMFLYVKSSGRYPQAISKLSKHLKLVLLIAKKLDGSSPRKT